MRFAIFCFILITALAYVVKAQVAVTCGRTCPIYKKAATVCAVYSSGGTNPVYDFKDFSSPCDLDNYNCGRSYQKWYMAISKSGINCEAVGQYLVAFFGPQILPRPPTDSAL